MGGRSRFPRRRWLPAGDAKFRLGVAALLLWATGPAQTPVPGGGFPEGQSPIQELLLHFDPDLAGKMYPTVRDLLRALPDAVQIRFAVESAMQISSVRLWLHDLGLGQRLRVVVAGRPLTPWARDRMVAIAGPSANVFLSPPQNRVPSDRWGDVLAARALAELTHREHACVGLAFEGGNVLFTRDRVLFTRSLLVANQDEADRRPKQQKGAEVLQRIRDLFGREPLPLGATYEPPHEHLDMFLTVVDDRTVILGAPQLAETFLIDLAKQGLDSTLLPDFDRWTVQAQRAQIPAYEEIKAELEKAGFRVLRIPILHGEDGMLTWNNALVEKRGSERRAYVPVYGVPYLDELALETYEKAGYKPFPIDVSRIAHLGGTVRCLTNVTAWGRASTSVTAPVIPSEKAAHRE